MPSGQVIEMVDGQVVEVPGGSLMQMVNGALVEIERSPSNSHRVSPSGMSAPGSDPGAAAAEQRESELNAKMKALAEREAAVVAKETAVSARDTAVAALQTQLRQREEQVRRRESELRGEKDSLERQRQQIQQDAQASAATTEHGAAHGQPLASAVPQRPAETLEPYTIQVKELDVGALIGTGSFAEVFKGEWRLPCAIKKMKGSLSREQMAEFAREADLMRSLRHPGIVRLLGVCVEPPHFYLVQELVPGGNIFDLLHKRGKRLTYGQVLQTALQIADAMAYLHDKKIVHRDLKPQNCLLDDKGVVKLCDFGLARMKSSKYVNTQSNTAGTPAYQSPEMLRDEPITEKVDLYSFGILLWEMYTGRLPWSDKNCHQMIHTVCVTGERPPMLPDTPPAFAELIRNCWAPKPDRRPTFAVCKERLRLLAAEHKASGGSTDKARGMPPMAMQRESKSKPHRQHVVHHAPSGHHGVPYHGGHGYHGNPGFGYPF
mmetsp:Transcript_50183/g.117859  ORF Transcript_50183/g.117859 Transcript_50183/m.117859 type:complete len:490 (-) Transcript_50183:109-1578(-)